MAQGYIESKANMELEVIAEEYFEKLAIAHHLHLKISKEMQCLESIYCAKNLRTLFLLSCDWYYRHMLLSNSFHHFKYAVENLIHLRCLHMLWRVQIEELLETFCNLYNLQTLIFECSYISKLSQGMSKQINLRHLIFHKYDDNHYDDLGEVVFPKGIGKLIGLRTLSVFNISDKDDREGCKLGELKNLNQLRGTFTINGMRNVANVNEAQNAQLKDKINLRGLVLSYETADVGDNEVGISEMEKFLKEKSRMENDVKVLNAL
ncbi:putative disease resistance protein rga3 [Quercus suber]|uniref:Disease resistance protein rga3 n=1 Tax=Quercus suber TaxID=58331 RepID=A0AAW0KJZ4_QUESU